jgi:low temperature requirement protein LtrA
MNYSWSASAYDTDDWVFRLATAVQMVGVVVWPIGLEDLFGSLAARERVEVRVMVVGYVVMRFSRVFLWSLVARHDPGRATAARWYIGTIAVTRAGWLILALLRLPLASFVVAGVPLLILKLAGPTLAERRTPTRGTPGTSRSGTASSCSSHWAKRSPERSPP